MANRNLRDQWLRLVEAIKAECRRHNQDPEGGVLEISDETMLKVSLPLDDSTRFTRIFDVTSVWVGEHLKMASEFYRDYFNERQRQRIR